MANADRNDLKKSRIEQTRNQREEAPRTPGAETNEEPLTPEEAEKEALRTVGKTRINTPDDRPT